MRRYLLHVYSLFFGIVAFGADQFSKQWVVGKFSHEWTNVYEVFSFFNLVLVYNEGISFGLFSDIGLPTDWFLSILAVLICCVLLWLMLKSMDGVDILSFGLVIGGALGNVFDRILFGGVIDFLDFHVLGYHWPAFNLADSFIFVGVGVLLIQNFVIKRS